MGYVAASARITTRALYLTSCMGALFRSGVLTPTGALMPKIGFMFGIHPNRTSSISEHFFKLCKGVVVGHACVVTLGRDCILMPQSF